MKIVGLTYYDGSESLVIKSDSSMLVNRKPLFVADTIGDLQALPCCVLRVARLGRGIAPRFASRYYDAIAPGVDFFAADLLRKAKAEGKPWTEAVAFENSLAIGNWQDIDQRPLALSRWLQEKEGQDIGRWPSANSHWSQETLDQAVARVSQMLTIRQGDLIYVAANEQPMQLQREDIIRCVAGEVEQLYCKIK